MCRRSQTCWGGAGPRLAWAFPASRIAGSAAMDASPAAAPAAARSCWRCSQIASDGLKGRVIEVNLADLQQVCWSVLPAPLGLFGRLRHGEHMPVWAIAEPGIHTLVLLLADEEDGVLLRCWPPSPPPG